MNRQTFVASALASLCACGKRAGGDRLEMSIVAVSQELDPYTAANLETAELSWIYADGLAGDDPARPEMRSLCARSPSAGAFGSLPFASFRYELRPGIRWHDGKPLLARDVVDCYQRLKSSTWVHQRPFSIVKEIFVHNDREFTVELTKSDPRFPLAFFSPFGSPGVPLVRPGNLPIGTGPFRVASKASDAVIFENWQSPRGNAAVPTIRLQYLANGDTQNLMLSTGDTDVALFVPHDYVLTRGIPYFRKQSGVAYLVVNARGVLSSPSLRSAFASAVDRDEIARKIYRNWSPLYDSVVAAGVPGAHIDLAPAFDPARARRALANLSKPIELAAYTDAQRTILLVQNSLSRIGVRSSIRTYPVQEYLAPQGPLRSGKFDVALFGEYFSLDPDLGSTWGCDAIPPKGGNFSRLCDPLLDTAARRGDLRAALEALRDDAAVIPLVRSVLCIGLSKRLRGAHNPPDLVPSVYQCAQWSIA